ncbi:MAG: hypothetical protein COT89_01770 [Candidatus Colwellbacteria bacterium CG10_big_fil_rev_8_21_14_0_10_42_22]|uniref:R3H domain-containing protein n=1 Tax=Candidatus Colwellbacteria bacterium CG10_big_fil_rev_8_21_14_0_10_42_22 TaxID=1974540 RepID=A0A2H0VFW1_9BACT|nr:MAG: hypothetical protein COT89_01770 [Candidatus Colwellbacteria bacterium CG10_big_fil_rev_8_21_14_0_10_42_22]
MMEEIKNKIQKALDVVGFDSLRIETDEKEEKITIVIRDRVVSPTRTPELVSSITHLARQIAKEKHIHISVDVNDYRKERETLITKLARAAAKKAAVTNGAVPLPAMNAYERRLVHTELSMNPNVHTESEGEDKERHVVVNPADN